MRRENSGNRRLNVVFKIYLWMLFLLSGLVMTIPQCSTQAKQNEDSRDVKLSMWAEKTAQSFIQRNPEPDSIHMIWDNNHFSWQAGYVMFAMEKIWKLTGDSLYFNYIKKYIDQQIDGEGYVFTFDDSKLDNFLPGYSIIFMYEQTHEEKYKIAAQQVREGFNKYPRNSDGLFWHGTWAKNQSWIDGVFMGQMFLARYGSVIGNSDYAFDEVVKQMTLMADHCQKENGLILHGWDESKEASWANKTTGLAPEVWSEGLGWYAVLIADVFDYLPEDHPGYEKLVFIHKQLCEGLKNTQDPETGMWCQVVDKYNEEGFIDLLDCSSIGIVDNYNAYITSPKEVSPFGAFGSFIIATSAIEFSE